MSEQVPLTMGQILKVQMKMAGLNVTELAMLLGISRNHMSMIVNDRAKVKAKHAILMAECFKFTDAGMIMRYQSACELDKLNKETKEEWSDDTPVGKEFPCEEKTDVDR